MVTYNPSQATTPITTLVINTVIYGGGVPPSVYEDAPFNVNCMLREFASGLPIVGRTIDFYYVPEALPPVYVGSQVTGPAGDVGITVAIPDPGSNYLIRYEFLGDATYDPTSTDDGPFQVLESEIATTLTVSAPTSVEVNELFEIAGQLRRNDTDEGLVGQTINFTYNGTSLGSIVTGGGGFYGITVSLPHTGTFTITASFAGASGFVASKGQYALSVIGIEYSLLIFGAVALGVIYLMTRG